MAKRYAIAYVSSGTFIIAVEPHETTPEELEDVKAPEGHQIFEEVRPSCFVSVAHRGSGQWLWEGTECTNHLKSTFRGGR